MEKNNVETRGIYYWGLADWTKTNFNETSRGLSFLVCVLICSFCNTNNLSTLMNMEYYNPPSTLTTKLVNVKAEHQRFPRLKSTIEHWSNSLKINMKYNFIVIFILVKYVNDQRPTNHILILPILPTFTLPFPG